ncbi:hypothetical protein FRC11_013059, partial [Ceratobasidium sp. 423]
TANTEFYQYDHLVSDSELFSTPQATLPAASQTAAPEKDLKVFVIHHLGALFWNRKTLIK